MTTQKTTTFTVETTGAGRVDYSAKETTQQLQTIQNVLNQTYPQQSIASNQFDDYAELTLTSAWQTYNVGANANKAKAGSWAEGATAKNIAFYSTIDFLVKYNYDTAVEHEIPSDILKSTEKRTQRIYVRAKGNNSGTVKIWLEG